MNKQAKITASFWLELEFLETPITHQLCNLLKTHHLFCKPCLYLLPLQLSKNQVIIHDEDQFSRRCNKGV